MASLRKTLSDPLYRNWVTAGLALKITKDGIQSFVDGEVCNIQQKALISICQVKALPAGTVCNRCTTPNVLPCPTKGICQSKGGCKYHKHQDPSKWPTQCPSGICNEIRDCITNSHRFSVPSWHNTNAKDWCNNSWEWAKCYMPVAGYGPVSSAVNTDFTGLLSVIINHKEFQNAIAENLTSKNNLFCQARTIRNEIMHTSNFQIPDAKLNTYIDTLTQLLSDSKCLVRDTNAVNAVSKLKQVKSGSLVVTSDDEMKIMEQFSQTVKEKTQKGIAAIKTMANDKENQIEDKKRETFYQMDMKKKECLEVIETLQKESKEKTEEIDRYKKEILHALHSKGKEQTEHIEAKKQKAINEMQDKCKEQIEIELECIKKERSDQHGQQSKFPVAKNPENSSVKSEQTYLSMKKDLQTTIIKLYKESCCKTSLYPLMPEKNDVDINEIYVQPSMEQVNADKSTPINSGRESKSTIIDSYKDIFLKDSQQQLLYKKIYIIGKAGVGKSTFCQKMITTWCSAHTKHSLLNQTTNDETLQESAPHAQHKIAREPTSCIQHEREELTIPIHQDKSQPKKLDDKETTQFQRLLNNICCVYSKRRKSHDQEQTQSSNTDQLAENISFLSAYKNSKSEMSSENGSQYLDHVNGNGLSEDEQVMLTFEFLFYVSLRNTASHSYIEDMIQMLVSDPSQQNMLSTILYKEPEKCLILLDGLDEWSPPKDYQPHPFANSGLPARKTKANYTTITTTRPCNMEVLRLNSSEIDQQIKMKGLSQASRTELIKSVVRHLNFKHERALQATDFEKVIDKKKLRNVIKIPVILKQLICLWHAGKTLGKSQCEIYAGMINLLFELAEKHLIKKTEYMGGKTKRENLEIQLPKCFDEQAVCKEFKPLLLSLGKLSVETLFHENAQSSLVFESREAEICGLSETEIEDCLKVGILSQSTAIGENVSRKKKLSFLHKTFQEFLAAVYISLNHAKLVQQIFKFCNTTDKVDEMSKVFIFVSGMDSKAAQVLSKYIYSVAYDSSHYSNCISYGTFNFQNLNVIFPDEYLLQKLMRKCAKESSENLNENSILHIESIVIDEKTSKNVSLEHSFGTNKENITIAIIENVPLSKEIKEWLMQVKPLERLAYYVSGENQEYCYCLICRSKSTLTMLALTAYPSTKWTKNQLSSILNSIKHLQVVILSYIKCTHTDITNLMAFISKAKQMKEIHLDKIHCSDCRTGECSSRMDLSNHQTLQKLSLAYVFVEKIQVNTSQLQKCIISTLGNACATQSVLQCLVGAPNLQVLKMNLTDFNQRNY